MSGLVSSVRRALYRKLFDLNTRSGRRFEGMCALFALLSVIVIFIESGVGTQYHLTFEEWRIFCLAGGLYYSGLYPRIFSSLMQLGQSR